MIVLHHLENSRSQRILWLLEELGLDYEIRKYARDPETKLAPAELQKMHPLGKAPILTDGENTLAESVRSSSIWLQNTMMAGFVRPRVLLSNFYIPTGCTMPKGRSCR